MSPKSKKEKKNKQKIIHGVLKRLDWWEQDQSLSENQNNVKAICVEVLKWWKTNYSIDVVRVIQKTKDHNSMGQRFGHNENNFIGDAFFYRRLWSHSNN